MADVTGTIGNEYVELNNAATEATLRALLMAVTSANKQNVSEIRRLAEKTGAASAGGATVDPGAVQSVNTGLMGIGQKVGGFAASVVSAGINVGKALGDFGGKLLEGQAQTSDLLKAFTALPGPIGKVAEGFRLIQLYQEQNFKTFQQITSVGVNFGGELTAVRSAMAAMRLTQEEYVAFNKANSQNLAKMGSDVNNGAKNFKELSNALQEGETGIRLKALGFTAAEVNSGLASFVSASGGRSRQEMQNTAALEKSAKAYLEQLDALARLTGESREEQEAQAKERAANAALQNHLSTLSVEERAKAEAALAQARQRGGKGAEQALMSRILGLPPMTGPAKKFEAFATNAGEVLGKYADTVKDKTKTIDDIGKLGASLQGALIKDVKDKQEVLRVLSLQQGENAEIATDLLKIQNRSTMQGIETEEDAQAQEERIRKEQLAQQTGSQARTQATFLQSMEEIRKSLIDKFINPIVQLVEPVLNRFGNFLKDVLVPKIEQLGNYLNNEIIPMFKKMWTTVSEMLEPWLSAAGVALEILWGIVTRVGEFIGGAFKLSFEALKVVVDLLKEPFEFLGNKVKSALEGFQKLDAALGGSLTNAIAGVVTGLLGLKAILMAKEWLDAKKAAGAAGAAGPGGGGTGGGGLLTRRGYSPDKPLFVQLVGGFGGRGRGRGRGRAPTAGGGSRPGGAPAVSTPPSPPAGGGGATAARAATTAAAGAGTTAATTAGSATAGAGAGAGAAGAAGSKFSVPKRFLDILKTVRGVPGLAALVGALDLVNIGLSKGQYPDESAFYADIAKSISSTAGGVAGGALGSALGSLVLPGIGTIAGGAAGWMIGAYGGDWFAGKVVDYLKAGKEKVPMAAGGIVTKPTNALIGEAGQPEAVLPLDRLGEILQNYSTGPTQNSSAAAQKLPGDVSSTSDVSWESLHNELQRLNNISSETLKYIKETAEYSRRTVDATRALSGDLFSM
jgi:hypothetical protein